MIITFVGFTVEWSGVLWDVRTDYINIIAVRPAGAPNPLLPIETPSGRTLPNKKVPAPWPTKSIRTVVKTKWSVIYTIPMKYVMYKMHSLCTSATSSFPVASLSSPLGCGARRGPARTLHASLDPMAPWGALFSRDRFPLSKSQAGSWKTPQKIFVSIWCCITVPQALKLSNLWQQRYNSSHTPSSPLYHGHERCFCVSVCAMFPVVGHTSSGAGTSWMLRCRTT